MQIRIGRLRRDRGLSVARPSPLGNPFVIGVDGDRDEVIRKYRAWLPEAYRSEKRVGDAIERIVLAAEIRDVTLLCHCAPLPCHASVVAELVCEVAEARARALQVS